jgi:alpha-tubulin suppressor-like RCC1 family protein
MIKTDNSLWACGYNNYGQLGNGNTTNYSSPIQIGSLTNWKQISCGAQGQIMAIKTDGTLWSWGSNQYGELGNGTTTYYSSPVQIGSLTNWKQVSSGYYHAVALKTDGTIWGWGRNQLGQLGVGSTTPTAVSSPIQIGSLTSWAAIGCGYNNTFGILRQG